jgi:high-affinity Fe2+/Pb2+ permease
MGRSLPQGGLWRTLPGSMKDGPSVLSMIAAVAILVALVILVFFGIGYGFGRKFL